MANRQGVLLFTESFFQGICTPDSVFCRKDGNKRSYFAVTDILFMERSRYNKVIQRDTVLRETGHCLRRGTRWRKTKQEILR